MCTRHRHRSTRATGALWWCHEGPNPDWDSLLETPGGYLGWSCFLVGGRVVETATQAGGRGRGVRHGVQNRLWLRGPMHSGTERPFTIIWRVTGEEGRRRGISLRPCQWDEDFRISKRFRRGDWRQTCSLWAGGQAPGPPVLGRRSAEDLAQRATGAPEAYQGSVRSNEASSAPLRCMSRDLWANWWSSSAAAPPFWCPWVHVAL